jgi:hypothetical protein
MQYECVILSSVVCLALQYFSTSSYKMHDFRNKNIDLRFYVSSFCTNFDRKNFYSKNSARYDKKMYIDLHVNSLYSFSILTKF